MSAKQYYHDIDGVKVAQLVNVRKYNVTTLERDALALTLGVGNTGLFVYDTDEKLEYTWDGTQFVGAAINIAGDVIFKGAIDASLALDNVGQPQPVEPVSGYEYVVTTAGTLTLTGVTFSPSAVAEVGDRVLFASPTLAYVQQRNDEQATETTLGNVRLASQAEVNAGTDAIKAVTPLTLQTKLNAQFYPRQYFATVNLVAATPFTVTHNLGLVDRDAFQINTMLGNSQVSLDVDSVDANSLTLTSLVALTGVKVTVTGAKAAV